MKPNGSPSQRLRTALSRLCWSLATSLISSWLAAAPITINLESSPGRDGLLGTRDDVETPSPCVICGPLSAFGYEAVGVNFTSGTLFVGSFFPNHGAGNHYSSSTVPDATFSRPIYRIRLTSYSWWNVTLYAFDASGNVLATNTFNNPEFGYNLAGLEVSSTVPIARFTVRPEGCEPAASWCQKIINIDDMVFDTEPLVAAYIPVGLDIKPGDEVNSIHSAARGKLPVAILSAPGFHAPAEVTPMSLSFGHSGNEQSLLFCDWAGNDVNGDGIPDLVCHFDTLRSAFESGDTEGILKGQTIDGVFIRGTDAVRVVAP